MYSIFRNTSPHWSTSQWRWARLFCCKLLAWSDSEIHVKLSPRNTENLQTDHWHPVIDMTSPCISKIVQTSFFRGTFSCTIQGSLMLIFVEGFNYELPTCFCVRVEYERNVVRYRNIAIGDSSLVNKTKMLLKWKCNHLISTTQCIHSKFKIKNNFGFHI